MEKKNSSDVVFRLIFFAAEIVISQHREQL